MENHNLDSLLQKLLWLCALILCAFFLYGSLHVFLADSELWSLSFSRFFWSNDAHSYALHYKPAFYAPLHALTQLGLPPDLLPLAARYLFALIAIFQLYLTLVLGRRLFGDETAAWLTVLVVLSSTFFLLRGFRIRSDYMATTLFLLTLFFMTSPRWPQSLGAKTGFAISAALMLASTPKSFYLVGLLAAWAYKPGKMSLKKIPTWFLISAGAALSLTCLLLFFAPTLKESYLLSFKYFLNSFNHPDQPPYFSSEAFKYFFRLFQDNPLILALVGLHVYFCFYPPDWSKSTQNLRWASALALVPMIFHNHRTPFFLLSFLPPLLIFSGKDLKEIFIHKAKFMKPSARYVALGLLAAGLTFQGVRLLWKEGDSNAAQLKFLRDTKPFLDHLLLQGENVIDVAGIFLHAAGKPVYLGVSDDIAREGFFYFLRDEKPNWILDSYRLSQFGGEKVIDHIADNYVRLPGGFWHRAQRQSGPEKIPLTDFRQLWKSEGSWPTSLILQPSGPRDELTTPRLEGAGLSFTYHSPLPLNLLGSIDTLNFLGPPYKGSISPMPVPVGYPLDSYTLFYFDARP